MTISVFGPRLPTKRLEKAISLVVNTRATESLSRYQKAGDLKAVQAINAELKRVAEGKVNLESISEEPVSQIKALQAILKRGFEPMKR